MTNRQKTEHYAACVGHGLIEGQSAPRRRPVLGRSVNTEGASPRGKSTRPARSKGGFSLLEVMIAFTVLSIAIGAVTSSLLSTMSLRRINRETTIASDAAQSALEDITGGDFATMFARFNATGADDPPAPMDSPGGSFAVLGLTANSGDADGVVGEIVFPGDGVVLREDSTDYALGMPRDLNGDGLIDANNHAGDYIVLPVRVRLVWSGEGGTRNIEFMTTLVEL